MNNKEGNKAPALEVINFTKKYKGAQKPAVENITFTVQSGEFHGFIGANGAGKTTTIKSLIGAYVKFEGEVKMFGHKNSTIEAKKRIGYIPETAKFPKGFSTLKYITYMSYMSGLSMEEAKKYAKNILKKIGLESIQNRNPNSFSSGQKKKVLLAQALVHDPDIIIMDEPAANLDPKARIDFFDTLKELQKKGKAIFISSHILAELDKYADSVTIIDGGKIVFSDTVAKATINKDLEFLIETSDKKELEDLLKKTKYKFKSYKSGFLVKLINDDNVRDMMKKLGNSKMTILTFKNNKMTLDEIYSKYVKLGSVETGIEFNTKVGNDD
ncbi:MAG: ABC transporter ATP-binding protein [Mycoplasma sp.]|nr:ABC transporter ATP-binding protein [Mycoplasma sp.]